MNDTPTSIDPPSDTAQQGCRNFAFGLLLLLPWMLIFTRLGAELCTAGIGILFLWRSAITGDWRWMRSAFMQVAILAWVWLMFAVSPLALNPEKSFLLALPWIRYILLFTAIHYWLLVTRRALLVMGSVLAVMLAFCAIDALWQYQTGLSLTQHLLARDGRLTGPFENPKVGIFMARFMLPAAAIIALFAIGRLLRVRLWMFLGLVGCAATILLTGERTAFFLSTAALGLVAALVAVREKTMRSNLLIQALALIAAVVMLFITQTGAQSTLTRTMKHVEDFSHSPYGVVFGAALNIARDHWVTGVGIQGVRELTPVPKPDATEQDLVREHYIHTHNPYLEWFAEAGAPGLALFVAMILCLLREAVALLRNTRGVAIIGPTFMLGALLFNFFPFMSTQSYFSNWTGIGVWASLGMVFAVQNLLGNQAKIPARRLQKPLQHFVKRGMDIFGALLALMLFLPLLLWAAVGTYVSMGAPILFRQKRPGLNEEPFYIYKFRTMRNATDANGVSLSDEKRLTAFGDRMRRWSIDELPQLLNILKGEMSFVGPRPLLYEYFPYYTPTEMRRHEVKPGVTGWAQIHGRNALGWDDKLAMDVWYVDHWSPWLDIKIILKTALTVLRREGVTTEGHATFLRLDDARRVQAEA